MNKKYKVKIKIVYSGFVEVTAEDRREAESIAFYHFSVNGNPTFSTCSSSILDWNIDLKPDKIINRRAKNV